MRHPEIRAHRDASAVRSYSLVGRLPSRDLVFPPSNERRSGNLQVSPCGKRKLGSRKNANRHSNIFRRSEPTCASTKFTCGEFVANLRRPRPDTFKAVVTHLGTPL